MSIAIHQAVSRGSSRSRCESGLRLVCVDHLATQDSGRGVYREMARDPGIELTLVVPPLWRDNFRDIPVEPSRPNDPFRLVVLPILFPGKSNRCLHPGLGALLRRIKPDVVFTQSEPEDFLLTQIGLIRAIWGLSYKIVFVTSRNIHYGRLGLPYKFGWVYGCAEMLGLRFGDYCFSFSGQGPETMAARGFHAVEVLPHFVDTKVFRPVDASSLRESLGLTHFTIGCFGRLVPEKGVGLVLSAIAGLEQPVQLLVVGNGPHLGALRELARQLGVAANVVYRPSVLRHEMPGYICACDAVVLPSYATPKWKEQFGRILIEAMACGVPLIGSDSGDIPRVIGEAGLIFPEKDVAGLRTCIRRMMQDTGLRQRLREAGLERAFREFSAEAVAAKRLRAVRALLDGRARSDR